MEKSSEEKFESLIRSAKFPVFVCGAGISYGAAPLAQDVEDGLLSAIGSISHRHTKNPMFDLIEASHEVRKEYLTLEMFASSIGYRIPDLIEPLLNTYKRIFSLSNINRSNISLSNSFIKGFPKIILTSNFDDGICQGLEDNGAPFRILTDANILNKTPEGGDICAYHGTVYKPKTATKERLSGPSTITARELAHPFLPAMATYIDSVFSIADMIFFIGHRGEDFYDMNLLIKSFIGVDNRSSDFQERKAKFYCVPHCGNSNAVSEFYFENFLDENVLDLGPNPNWLADICDNLSGTKTVELHLPQKNGRDVEDLFLEEIELKLKNKNANKRIRTHAKALLDDINGSIYAVWAVTEHYRLESLALSQKEISAFGRPPKKLKFFGVQVSDLLNHQNAYQDFRRKLDPIREITADSNAILQDGADLFHQLNEVANQCRAALTKSIRPIEKACCLLMGAIAYDYMGLIAMRFESKKTFLGGLRSDYNQFCRSSELFRDSWMIADEAGAALSGDEALSAMTVKQRKRYQVGLEEIVSWKTWRMAPRENYSRSSNLTVEERVDWLLGCISDRMVFIRRELRGPAGSSNYSVTGYAALCSLRVAELMRVLGFGEPKDSGEPDFTVSISISKRSKIVANAVRIANECIDVGKANSSQKNARFMSAYDALVLAALLKSDIPAAKKAFENAKQYAGTNKECLDRVKQIATRSMALA